MLEEITQTAEKICGGMKNDEILGKYFTHGNLWAFPGGIERPWKKFNYWNGWYALSSIWEPKNILEIGTGFGFGTIALVKGAIENLELIISLDLGNFWGEDNIIFAAHGIYQHKTKYGFSFMPLFIQANTQPPPYTDNKGNPTDVDYWENDKELVGHLNNNRPNLILIDGKHTGDGLYNDLTSFFHFGENCLLVCDDLQHPDAMASFLKFTQEEDSKIKEWYIWDFLHCNTSYPKGTKNKRIQGLILK